LECLEALAVIGAKDAHSLLKNACQLFPEGKPSPDTEIRRGQLEHITKGRRDLDDLVKGGIEFELYGIFLKYWDAHEP
jgi:hypothetical protein